MLPRSGVLDSASCARSLLDSLLIPTYDAAMQPTKEWFKKQFRAFLLFPEYIREIASQWMNLLFGAGLMAVGFAIWSAFGHPPLTVIFVVAVLIAGFYAWQASYVRFVPAIRVDKYKIDEVPTNHANIRRTYVQIVPECVSDAPIEECRGYLLRVWKRDPPNTEWQTTPLNQPLELNWSYVDTPVVTLQPNTGQRLNLAWIDNQMPRLLPDVTKVPNSAYSVFSVSRSFKFDVQITGKNCPAVNLGVVIENAWEWNNLRVRVVP
jgi:hypothetical protein